VRPYRVRPYRIGGLGFGRQYDYAVQVVGHNDERVQDDAGADGRGPQPFVPGEAAVFAQPDAAAGDLPEQTIPAVGADGHEIDARHD
jgi:hypothetical protein